MVSLFDLIILICSCFHHDRQKRKLEEMYDALRKEHEQLKRSTNNTSSTPNSQAVIQRPNPYAFAPTFNGFDDIRHLPSASVSGNFYLSANIVLLTSMRNIKSDV